ncbi:DUF397 domain-containing protein [Streptomyces sp. NPDC090306]|uniref:DUF397 domain-containing protein n=1 Tax=Streptomyces sp. NPDC090306 TaxID=3365961 RepID=UPI0038116981
MTDRPATAFTGTWRKSSYSNDQGGSCVEVLDGHPAGVPVRDSKVPGGPTPVFSKGSWAAFVVGLKDADRFPA